MTDLSNLTGLSGRNTAMNDARIALATPERKTAVQLPAYAAAARSRLTERDGRSWIPRDLAYIAFGPAPHYVPLASAARLETALAAGETRLVAVVDRIERGDFPPRPSRVRECTTCPFDGVCRKDYVRGD